MCHSEYTLTGKVGDAVQEGDGKSSHLVLTRTEFQWLGQGDTQTGKLWITDE